MTRSRSRNVSPKSNKKSRRRSRSKSKNRENASIFPKYISPDHKSSNSKHKERRKSRSNSRSKSPANHRPPVDRRLYDSLKKLKKMDDEDRRAEMERFRVLKHREEDKGLNDELNKKVEIEVKKRLASHLERRELDIQMEVDKRLEYVRKQLDEQLGREYEAKQRLEREEWRKKEEENHRKRSELEALIQKQNKEIQDLNRQLAEERLEAVEEKRIMLEEKYRLEEVLKKKEKHEQKVILNKGKAVRPRLSFTLKPNS